MKKFYALLIIVFLSLALLGCAGAGDYNIDLHGGYSLIRSSAHMVTINKRINDSSWDSPIIPAKVVQIATNDKYILAKQVGLKRRNPNNSSDTYEIPDETKVNYWIFQIKDGKTYGPLALDDFNKKKKEMSITSDLVLTDIESYKNTKSK